MSTTRNLGIRSSNGKYVAFLDADDVWFPHKLARQVAILESQPKAAMVYGASQYWYSWTGIAEDLVRDYVCDLGMQSDILMEPPTLFNLLLRDTLSPCPSDILVLRTACDRIGGFEESFTGNYQLYEDQAFLTKLYLQEAHLCLR